MIKDSIRNLLNYLHLDLTKNLKYDRLTKIIIKRYIHKNWTCVDIGCHKGEIMDMFLETAYEGVDRKSVV